ncbi:tRNA lysidine(34) synthetase TilS [Thermicanus aegyptius]|uniref:tRNA lysidine(34) synthetase TilS n=1 Tax=Thermicanus aegyptius TaxID=94009 RepID=UPI0003F9129D|nr:tRNA lysidine(34) synthetase TilS [Thermicanus aegyptius]
MEKTLGETVRKHHMIKRGDRVLVGISGGPDSVALAHWLYRHREEYGIEVALAHYHHGLRGKEADEDEAFVRHLAKEWNLPYYVGKAPLKEIHEEELGNLQDLAREYRYRFFRETGEKIGANKIAIAHHLDDQVETMLMRFVRGTGPGGLVGIPYTRPLTPTITVIRPFLEITRKQIEDYLKRNLLCFRIDSSNKKTDYLRNRLRIETIPQLQAINPNLSSVLLHLSEMLREDEDYLASEAEDVFSSLTTYKEPEEIRISLAKWRETPFPLQRRAIKLICNYLVHVEEEVPYFHVEAIRKIFAEDHPKEWNLPWGITVIARYGEGIFRMKRESRGRGFHYPVQIPGSIWIAEMNKRLICSVLHEIPRIDGEHALFDYEEVMKLGPLSLRSRRAGDYLYLKGLAGHRKVKDIFIDEKIPKEKRDQIPLLCAGKEVLWIPGLRKSGKAEVLPGTRLILSCKLEEK